MRIGVREIAESSPDVFVVSAVNEAPDIPPKGEQEAHMDGRLGSLFALALSETLQGFKQVHGNVARRLTALPSLENRNKYKAGGPVFAGHAKCEKKGHRPLPSNAPIRFDDCPDGERYNVIASGHCSRCGTYYEKIVDVRLNSDADAFVTYGDPVGEETDGDTLVTHDADGTPLAPVPANLLR